MRLIRLLIVVVAFAALIFGVMAQSAYTTTPTSDKVWQEYLLAFRVDIEQQVLRDVGGTETRTYPLAVTDDEATKLRYFQEFQAEIPTSIVRFVYTKRNKETGTQIALEIIYSVPVVLTPPTSPTGGM